VISPSMQGFSFNPLTDDRWPKLLSSHPRASVFHTREWLSALQQTYHYDPIGFTTCPPGSDLTNGTVFCRIRSVLSGSRLVSLPFSDHCEPLAANDNELNLLLSSLSTHPESSKCRYIEVRPLNALLRAGTHFGPCNAFFMHELELKGNSNQVFARFHKDSTQRKIRRAEREGLSYEEGRSEKLIGEFYRLLLLTRRRHQLPPQPITWFQQLATQLGENMKVRIASKNGMAIASMITLRFRNAMVYKYGCSDAEHHNLGGMHLLFWNAIQEAIQDGLKTFDLGRSDIDNAGLMTFKDRWGATRKLLTYWSMPPSSPRRAEGWHHAIARHVIPRIPDRLLVMAGQLLYKHAG
jgi:Acetyltransferase (GNAT) domain